LHIALGDSLRYSAFLQNNGHACSSATLKVARAERFFDVTCLMASFAGQARQKQAFEFQYMTAELTAYLDLNIAEEHVFRKGDFYVIEPGVVYAQKSASGTEILFIKVPPGNDKVPVDAPPEVEAPSWR